MVFGVCGGAGSGGGYKNSNMLEGGRTAVVYCDTVCVCVCARAVNQGMCTSVLRSRKTLSALKPHYLQAQRAG